MRETSRIGLPWHTYTFNIFLPLRSKTFLKKVHFRICRKSWKRHHLLTLALERQTIEQESYSAVQKLVCWQPCAPCFHQKPGLQNKQFILNHFLSYLVFVYLKSRYNHNIVKEDTWKRITLETEKSDDLYISTMDMKNNKSKLLHLYYDQKEFPWVKYIEQLIN